MKEGILKTVGNNTVLITSETKYCNVSVIIFLYVMQPHVGLGKYIDSSWIEKWFSTILRFSECIMILHRVDSKLSFEQQMALHAL